MRYVGFKVLNTAQKSAEQCELKVASMYAFWRANTSMIASDDTHIYVIFKKTRNSALQCKEYKYVSQSVESGKWENGPSVTYISMFF